MISLQFTVGAVISVDHGEENAGRLSLAYRREVRFVFNESTPCNSV
jgi:hypothetical protein